jgi:hypothetical protein
MKLVRPGKVTVKPEEQPAPSWWVGKRAECSKCSAVVMLTTGDAPAGLDSFSLRCPTPGCGNYIPIRPLYDRTGRLF